MPDELAAKDVTSANFDFVVVTAWSRFLRPRAADLNSEHIFFEELKLLASLFHVRVWDASPEHETVVQSLFGFDNMPSTSLLRFMAV